MFIRNNISNNVDLYYHFDFKTLKYASYDDIFDQSLKLNFINFITSAKTITDMTDRHNLLNLKGLSPYNDQQFVNFTLNKVN